MEKIYSRYYYPIEFYNPHVHFECNYNTLGLNEAEINALKEEEYKNKFIQLKELRQKEYSKRFNKSAILYQEEQKIKNKEEQYIKKMEKKEKLIKKQNYNKAVYQKNMKPFIKEKDQKENQKAKTLAKNNKSESPNKKKIQTINNQFKKQNFEENDFISEDKNYINKNNDSNDFEAKKILDDLNNKQSTNENTITNKNIGSLKKNFELDDNVIDLRMNLENQLLEEIRNKNNNLNNSPMPDEVNDKIRTIKRFRNYGYFPNQTQLEEEKKKKPQKSKKFSSEFERRRFIKALKNIITERLGEHNIYIQNICSCGNLHKQLNALVEKGNLTVYALTEVECANNCIFYKNKAAYLKNINDVLNSIKDLSYDNFHNNYKEQK